MVTADELRVLFRYDPETGHFWRIRSSGRGSIDRPAGTVNSEGYIKIGINYRLYGGHQLAWLYTYGEWPDEPLDHINCDASDNRIANLRRATPNQNQQNKRTKRISSTGLKGVNREPRCRSRWKAEIVANGQRYYLGLFPSPEEAAEARRLAAEKLHGAFARS